MEGITIKYIPVTKQTDLQKRATTILGEECFNDVPQKEKDEDFIAEVFGRVFAYQNKKIIGMLGLFKRNVNFDGKTINLGGMGGVCVTPALQRKGVGTALLKKGLTILKDKKCDIACLNVDLDKKIYGIYEKVGFKMMEREISFENIKGKIIKDKGTMFVPICSKEVYNLVMNSKKTFHYGRGYW